MKKIIILLSLSINYCFAQNYKILFDASKAQTSGNADWVIDADQNNMRWSPNAIINSGTESNAQAIPTPAYNTITTTTNESIWKGAISAWGIDCIKAGYIPETLPYNGNITYNDATNPQDLKNYKVLVLVEPNILYTSSEKQAILSFVQNGGGLFMIAGHDGADRNFDGYDAQDILNDLMANNPFGIFFDATDISEPISKYANIPTDTILSGPFGNPNSMELFGASTITIDTFSNNTVRALFFRNFASLSSQSNIVAARSNYGLGKVFALTDSSPADDGTGDANDILYNGYTLEASGNHKKIIMNATYWLMNGFLNPVSIAQTTSSILNSNFYPNPSNGIIYFNNNLPKQLYVYTTHGVLISTVNCRSIANLSNLQKGTYLLSYINLENNTKVNGCLAIH
jgi:hypothetical protein